MSTYIPSEFTVCVKSVKEHLLQYTRALIEDNTVPVSIVPVPNRDVRYDGQFLVYANYACVADANNALRILEQVVCDKWPQNEQEAKPLVILKSDMTRPVYFAVFVANIPLGTSVDQLLPFFEKYGKLYKNVPVCHIEGGGAFFVNFEGYDGAECALQASRSKNMWFFDALLVAKPSRNTTFVETLIRTLVQSSKFTFSHNYAKSVCVQVKDNATMPCMIESILKATPRYFLVDRENTQYRLLLTQDTCSVTLQKQFVLPFYKSQMEGTSSLAMHKQSPSPFYKSQMQGTSALAMQNQSPSPFYTRYQQDTADLEIQTQWASPFYTSPLQSTGSLDMENKRAFPLYTSPAQSSASLKLEIQKPTLLHTSSSLKLPSAGNTPEEGLMKQRRNKLNSLVHDNCSILQNLFSVAWLDVTGESWVDSEEGWPSVCAEKLNEEMLLDSSSPIMTSRMEDWDLPTLTSALYAPSIRQWLDSRGRACGMILSPHTYDSTTYDRYLVLFQEGHLSAELYRKYILTFSEAYCDPVLAVQTIRYVRNMLCHFKVGIKGFSMESFRCLWSITSEAFKTICDILGPEFTIRFQSPYDTPNASPYTSNRELDDLYSICSTNSASDGIVEWIGSIFLDKYVADIIEYGYDSLKALDAASEAEIEEMTREIKNMKKPHRVLFINEWRRRKTEDT